MLIDIRDLYKIYNEGKESEVRALDGVSLQIDRGEFVAIVGQSGSGKSTMMNVLGCLDIPTYGEYFLEGTDIGALTDKELARIRNREIGFIFQGYNLIQELDALENVTLPLIYRGVSVFDREDMAMAALAKVGMDGRAHHRPSEMASSSGWPSPGPSPPAPPSSWPTSPPAPWTPKRASTCWRFSGTCTGGGPPSSSSPTTTASPPPPSGWCGCPTEKSSLTTPRRWIGNEPLASL